ncbi:hypothetical protein [Mariniphaga sp.]|uniref:hypothetical protein n=1 Tax=Mariniphaga sp. TaxID=1954475 RepID=UPI00356B408C
METNEIISKIKECIKNAHKFSEGLGKSTSIHKDFLIDKCGIPSTEIHIALLEMKEKGEIEFTANDPVILLTDNFKKETFANDSFLYINESIKQSK